MINSLLSTMNASNTSGDWDFVSRSMPPSTSPDDPFSEIRRLKASDKAPELVAMARDQCDSNALLKIIRFAELENVPVFQKAAVMGDTQFFSAILTFVPVETCLKFLIQPNAYSISPMQSLSISNYQMANRINAIMVSTLRNSNNPSTIMSILESIPSNESKDFMFSIWKKYVRTNRFELLNNAGSTVGSTLRFHDIHYAALDSIYVSATQVNLETCVWDGMVAISATDNSITWYIQGDSIKSLVDDQYFDSKYRLFVRCTSAHQQLTPGTSLLLDMENAFPVPPTDREVIILSYHPVVGTVEHRSPGDHQAISQNGIIIQDHGYRDNEHYVGFRRGWYEGIYWRVVDTGHFTDHIDDTRPCLTGGVSGQPYKYRIRYDFDIGYVNKRFMVKLPGVGVVYCRGIGYDAHNPELACVIFNANGEVEDPKAFYQRMGRYNDIFH